MSLKTVEFVDEGKQDIIIALRNVLAEAKAGKVHQIMIMAVSPDRTYTIRSHGKLSSLEEIGLLGRAWHSCMADPTSVFSFDEEDPDPEGKNDDED